jgi:hypothetical protein
MSVRLIADCKTKGCTGYIDFTDSPGFSYNERSLNYDGPPLVTLCGACRKTHRYSLNDIRLVQTSDLRKS